MPVRRGPKRSTVDRVGGPKVRVSKRFIHRREASQWEVLLSWARAEAGTGKPGVSEMPSVQSIYPKLEAQADLSAEEETRLVGSLLLGRSPLLGFFMRTPTSWYFGSVAIADLCDLHTIQTFATYAPETRTMEELALRPATPPGLKVEDFVMKKMVGSPIAVTDDLDGQWCLMDGYSRCAELVAMHARGESPAAHVDMFVGLTAKARGWPLW